MDARKQRKSLNAVHNDEIWKDHISREIVAQKHWPEKWGYVLDIYKEIQAQADNKEDHLKNNNRENTFPKTNAQMIGWKSALNKLNQYGISEIRAKGKSDIFKTFDWPQESQ
ncbi:ciliary microtubule inner protein 1 isoform X2 [Hydra vulgaris]|uniref:Ciliary microtubule inner protein 1 isoform X2 n=1 Tax=Hydra vulgaris TaxID=6087 RepID=A0ABM4CHL6_HYDVU